MKERPLTIAFVTHEYPVINRLYGGIGVYVRILSQALSDCGHKIHVVTSAQKGLPKNWLDNKIEIHHITPLDPRRVGDPTHLKAYSLTVANYLRILDETECIDVVEFGDWPGEGWAFKPRSNQIKVVRVHTPSFIIREFENMPVCITDYEVDELERSSLESADLITSPSQLLAEKIIKRWDLDMDAFHILPNPVDINLFQPKYQKINDSNTVILCVNRYTPLKGVDIFVRAASIVCRKVPSVNFHLIGHGAAEGQGMNAEQYLRKLGQNLRIPDNQLHIHKRKLWKNLPLEYNSADICINPSLFESFSYTSAEALSCGRPLIITYQQGIREYLQDRNNCIIVPPGDDAAIASAIINLIENSALCEQIGINARKVVEQEFAMNNIAHLTETMYRSKLQTTTMRSFPYPIIKKSDQSKPLISVVIPCYNHAQYLPQAVGSIVGQSYKNWEIIIVNDGSPDNTNKVAEELINMYGAQHIRLLEKPNGGPADARNAGFNDAQGKWILPLDADDMFLEDFLQKAVELINKYPFVNLVSSNMQKFGAELGEWIPNDYSRERIRYENTFIYASLHKKDLWKESGGYYPGIPYGDEDWHYWISCSKIGIVPIRIYEKMFFYRVTPSSRFQEMLKHDNVITAMVKTSHPALYPQDHLMENHQIIAQAQSEIIDKLDDIIETFPHLYTPYFWRGLCLEQKGYFEQAVSDYMKSIDISNSEDLQPLSRLKKLLSEKPMLVNKFPHVSSYFSSN